MFVLDTDVCVDLERRYAPTEQAVRVLQAEGPLAVTAVTVQELVLGAYDTKRPRVTVTMVGRLLSAFDVLEYNGAAAWIAGRRAAELRQGRA